MPVSPPADATADALAFVARIGIGFSIIFSYPLNFVGLREGVLSLFGASEAGKRTDVHIISTLLLMLAVNGLALFVKVTARRPPALAA